MVEIIHNGIIVFLGILISIFIYGSISVIIFKIGKGFKGIRNLFNMLKGKIK